MGPEAHGIISEAHLSVVLAAVPILRLMRAFGFPRCSDPQREGKAYRVALLGPEPHPVKRNPAS